jgi:hypothetical protein
MCVCNNGLDSIDDKKKGTKQTAVQLLLEPGKIDTKKLSPKQIL